VTAGGSEGGSGLDGSGTARALCVLAPNPSPMTLDGTNTWVLAEPGGGAAIVVDPGPLEEEHLRRVTGIVAAAGRRVGLILLTHGHGDHSAGAGMLAEMTGAAVRAADPAHRLGEEGLAAGDVVSVAGCEVQVVGTPGHSGDSLSFLLPADGALLTGDTVLGRGTTVIAPDGDLGDYLHTLDELRRMADHGSGAGAAAATGPVSVLLPGHGPVLTEPARTLDFYIAHRQERLAEIEAALAAGDRTTADIAARVYAGVDPEVQRFAEWSVRAQLEYLKARGALPPGFTL
jgi:glyoxylase-like metal-dependent hydrolase (beta-lactamase superfamily II)